jgi:two-component system, LytTR family, sensor kinase
MKKKIIFDIGVWIVVFLLMMILTNAPNVLDKVLLCLLPMFLFYPHSWMLKRYFSEKKVIPYLLRLLALVVISSSFLYFSFAKNGGLKSGLNAFIVVLLTLFLSTAISYAYKGILLQIQYEKTKRRQVEAELKLLQSQVNPHFLFNTLNNIYAQNLIHQEEANDMILQLADLMRYQIESAKKNDVNIHDEVEFLENYIALEKKRLTDKTQVHFSFEKQDDTPLSIPPMLFIPFVENAFKYGIGTEGANIIKIHLAVKKHQILFEIENGIPARKQSVKSTKMGLENIKKRLDLLFPDKYQLAIKTDNQLYNVQLSIEI